MKAATRSKYGSGEVLSVKEIDKPTPTGDQVLIRVYAASVNRSDYHVLTGRPFLMRLFTGLFKPKLAVTGSDFAGQVEGTGPTATSFKVGDKVMGFGGGLGSGTHSQYFTFCYNSPEVYDVFDKTLVYRERPYFEMLH
jgi:NADPH:quinone reductase-like Zn-dependent oxidoreductase